MKKYILLCFLFLIFMSLTTQLYAQETDSLKEERLFQERIVKDTIDGVYIPKDISDCMVAIDAFTPDSIRESINNLPTEEFCSRYHLNLGMWIRNNWGLWGGSRLQTYFFNLGICEPDDMSGIILTSYSRHVKKEPLKFEEQIEKNKGGYDIRRKKK